jgi:hypothetical protein
MAWRTTAATQFQPSSLSLSQYNQLILLTYFGLLNYFFQLATGGFFLLPVSCMAPLRLAQLRNYRLCRGNFSDSGRGSDHKAQSDPVGALALSGLPRIRFEMIRLMLRI